jgi:hypothetical protein
MSLALHELHNLPSNAAVFPPGDEKLLMPETKHLEEVVAKPESIRGMSDAELQNLETRMVRKMDLVIM